MATTHPSRERVWHPTGIPGLARNRCHEVTAWSDDGTPTHACAKSAWLVWIPNAEPHIRVPVCRHHAETGKDFGGRIDRGARASGS